MAREVRIIVTPIDPTAAAERTGLLVQELQTDFRSTGRDLRHTLQTPTDVEQLANAVESFGQLGIPQDALRVRVGYEDKSHTKVPKPKELERKDWQPQVEKALAERQRRVSALPEQASEQTTATREEESSLTTQNQNVALVSQDEPIRERARQIAEERYQQAIKPSAAKVLDPTYWIGRALYSVDTVRKLILQDNATRTLYGGLSREAFSQGDAYTKLMLTGHGFIVEAAKLGLQFVPIVGDGNSVVKGLIKMRGVSVPESAVQHLQDVPGYTAQRNNLGEVRVRDVAEGIADVVGVVPFVPEFLAEWVVKIARDFHVDEGIEDAMATHDPEGFKKRKEQLFMALYAGLMEMQQNRQS